MKAVAEKKLLLVFFGSPHKKGKTARLLSTFLQAVGSDGLDVRVIDAYDEDVLPCTGCGFCKNEEACAKHDFDEIDALLRRADGIVVATPVYNLSFPSPLKAIVDRTQRYYEARFSLLKKPPIEKPKTAALLVTLGSDDLDGVDVITRQLKMVFSVMNTSLDGLAVWPHTDRPDGEERFAQAAGQARQAALAMRSKI